MDKNASTFEDVAKVASTYQKTVPVEAVNSKTSNIRANFENLAKEKEQEDRRKAEAERAQSVAKERQEQEEPRRQLDEQARARKQTPPASPAPQPAQERPPSSPVYEDAASFKAEPSYRGPVSEPEPVYSTEAAYYQDAHSQQGLAYAPEAQEEPQRQLDEQARARKQTPPASPAPQPAQERPPSSPVYEDAASFKAEPSYRGPVSEPEPVCTAPRPPTTRTPIASRVWPTPQRPSMKARRPRATILQVRGGPLWCSPGRGCPC
uniref:Uncharacterized protein n=1 Tax=Equus asinus TaxID=9793 RepID=A0A9L0ICE0_EQUAS